MACQKRYFYWPLLLCVALTAFSGCASQPPITKNFFDRFTANGIDLEEDVQYYVSKKITLTLNQADYPLKAGEGENFTIKTIRSVERKRITIRKNLPGKITKHYINTDDTGYLLEVGFERDHQNYIIKFGQLRAGDDEYYYLLYDEEDSYHRTIKYEDRSYTVNFDGSDRPYLFIKAKTGKDNNSQSRSAKGWKLGE
jgi:hypothetical protein